MNTDIEHAEEIKNQDVVIHDGSLYDYHMGINCGVLVKENVMKKLAKLQQKHTEDVRRLLTDEGDKGNVFPSMWTLHYPNGVQTVVKYIDASDSLSARISGATRSDQPTHHPLVFVAESMAEARKMADAHSGELHNTEVKTA